MKRTVILFIFSLGLVLSTQTAGASVLKNRFIRVDLDSASGCFSVTDLRTGKVWRQSGKGTVRLSDIQVSGNHLQASLSASGGLNLRMDMELPPESPELCITLSGESGSPMSKFLTYPYPFLPHDEDLFILPEHEGVGIPVKDFSILDKKYASEHVAAPMYNKQYRFYCGHDLSMTFWGCAGNSGSLMGIAETPNDASLRMQTLDGKLAGGIEWEASRSTFGYDRTVRYVFFDQGGYNAICKRYRAYAKEQGMLKTLAEKSVDNPNSLKFAQGALVWIFSPDTDVLVPQMLAAGMKNISVTGPMFTPGEVRRMNDEGVLNGVYDCVRSVLPAEFMDKVFRMDPTDVRQAFPDDVLLMKNGKPFDYGWPKNGYNGKVYRTLDVCDLQKAGYAKDRLDQILAHRPMTIHFYDTITAFPWTECYDPDHPTTRTQVREAREEVLRQAVEDYHQVLGAEAGHIYAVPYATYFEGMNHSRFFYYQIKGHPLYVYDHQKEIPAAYQDAMKVEHQYRLPLWELVNHDSCVTFTRWNTPNNKIHGGLWWDHMDLWNILYATPPMFMFINDSVTFWKTYKERYLQSYRNIVEGVLSKTAGQEMIRHDFLTEDKSVQQTTFSNGVQITVNFGTNLFTTTSGESIAPGGFLVRD